MPYCLNPDCSNPYNPDSNQLCHGCGNLLAETTESYDFQNRYRIIKVLAQKVVSCTYGALDLDFEERPCVIKKYIPKVKRVAYQQAKELFAREAKKLYYLNDHPNIPDIYGYFEQNNCFYLVQEFIEGKNLLKESLAKGPFSEAKILAILRDLLGALDTIHNNNVLHQDIKPENIIHRTSSIPSQFVPIDFGGPKLFNPTNENSKLLHLLGYTPREAIAGNPIPASDIYSLGATVVRLLTGCLPQAYTSDEVYDRHNHRWLWREYMQVRGMSVSEQLGNVLDLMLMPLPANRYQFAREVVADLPSPPPTQQIVSTTATSLDIEDPDLPRRGFLKFLVLGGAGTAATVIIGSLLRNNNSSPPYGQSVLQSKTFEFETIAVNSRGREVKRETMEAKFLSADLGNGVTIDLVSIPGGKFLMGSPENQRERDPDEGPNHWVKVPDFYISKYPITQAQWQAVMKNNPSYFQDNSQGTGAGLPVEQVTWHDSVEFCQKLSKAIGKKCRLPSEAEWEYACRAGTNTPFYFGETITTDLANYDGEYSYGRGPKGKYRKETTAVDSFPPNRFGLHDFHGNLWEWCADTWHNNYTGAPSNGKAWIDKSNLNSRILRGGSWDDTPGHCRSSVRHRESPEFSFRTIGFRVASS